MSLQAPPRSLAPTEIEFLTLGPHGTCVGEVSEAFALLLGKPAAEIAGRDLLDHVFAADRTDLRASLDALEPGRPATLECRFLQADGQAVYVECVVRPTGDGSGWCVSGTDTADLARLLSDRRALRTRLDLAIGQATVAMWDLELASMTFNWEPAAAAILGTTEDQLPATPTDFVEQAHPDDRTALTAALERLQSDGAAEVGVRVGSEDAIRHLSVRGRMLKDAGRRQSDHAVGLLLDITVEKALEEQLLRMSISDGLTGIRNRRGFDQALRGGVRRSNQADEPVSLLMIDIDHFKGFNDNHGHIVGDQALIAVSRALTAALRQEGDILARYGGEEFAAILPEADAEAAEQVADRLLDAVRGVRLRQAADWPLSVSVGVASRLPGDPKLKASELLERADRALYAAKRAGRDQRSTG